MAAVTNIYRLVWAGRLGATESWSCSLHIDAPLGLNLAASNFLIPLAAWMARADSHIRNDAKMDEIKFNEITRFTLPSGKFSWRYALPTSNNLLQNDAGSGAGGIAWPTQNTVAVSTRTALERGRGHAGRFYPPTGSFASFDGARLPSTDATAMAASAATLIGDLNDLVTVGEGRCVVLSSIGNNVETITGIRVGRVVDTMRSRRTSLAEEPSFQAVA